MIAEYFEKPGGKVTLGIDGFVDEVWQIIAKRKGDGEYELFHRMQDFAKAVYDCGAGGYANEILRKRRRYGGFTANTGKAAGQLGCHVTMVGMFGKDAIDPVFREFYDRYNVVSAGDPGISQVFEFTDGKLMLPYTEEIAALTWEYLVDVLSQDTIKSLFLDADVIGFGYWSQLRHFDDMVTKLCQLLVENGRRPRMFFDFADLRKRDRETLLHTLNVLAKLNEKIPMTLSLNEHEAALLFSYMGKEFAWDKPEDADKDIAYVRRQAGLDELVVHTPHFAVAATAHEGTAVVAQDYCRHPVITTGAGDNFNGGYMAALARPGELTLAQRLTVGNGVTGFYIRHGHSPNKDELLNFLHKGDSHV